MTQWRRHRPLAARLVTNEDWAGSRGIRNLENAVLEAMGAPAGVGIAADIDHDLIVSLSIYGWGPLLQEQEGEYYLDLVAGAAGGNRAELINAAMRMQNRYEAKAEFAAMDDDQFIARMIPLVAEIGGIQTQAAQIARHHGIRKPIKLTANRDLAHVSIDRELAAILHERNGRGSIRKGIISSQTSDPDDAPFYFPWSRESVIAMTAEYLSDGDNPPYVTFEGALLNIVDAAMPEILIAAMPGRLVGEIVSTGRPVIDARIIMEASQEERSSVYFLTLIMDPDLISVEEAEQNAIEIRS